MVLKDLEKEINSSLESLEKEYNEHEFSSYLPQLTFYKIHGLTAKENFHSKFIAFFLNPNKHKFGQVFLDYFIEMLEEQKPDNYCGMVPEKPFSCKDVITDRGKRIDHKKISGGRIDIGILNENPDKHIVIENKINSGDGCAQLARYKKMDRYKNATIVYLNPSGKPAPLYSLGDIKDNEYIIISYKKTIIDWIIKCKKYFELNNIDIKKGIANKIYFFLDDYLTVIKELTKVSSINDAILPILSKDLHIFFETHDQVKEMKKNNKNVKLSVFQKLCLNKVIPLKQYLIKEKFINNILNNLINDNDIGDGLLFKISDKGIMQKGWGFQFYKEKWEKVNVKIGFYFKKKNLRDCNFGFQKYASDNNFIPEDWKLLNSIWYPLEPMPEKYRNWYREVFYQFMPDYTGEPSFYNFMKEKLQVMCDKIEKILSNNP